MRLSICMVSDFSYPNPGGIESHIYTLSQCLMKRGQKVVVVTHSYEDRVGVRYMENGLKVYYLPMQIMADQVVLPSVFAVASLFRQIFIRERIDIVHGHSNFSPLAHIGILIGKFMGKKAVFTDHSLSWYTDVAAILTNKLLEITLSNVDHCICVSKKGEENTADRAKLYKPGKPRIQVIPNATDTTFFTPDTTKRDPKKITIVSVCRLFPRKGIDLLASVIPIICNKYPNVKFIIGGDGPERVRLENLREQKDFSEKIAVLGLLTQPQVRETLRKGDIFLNTSKTEAFCMAILEAASCGLQVVSTNVGGIPELKEKIVEASNNEQIVLLAEPNVRDLSDALKKAIEAHKPRNGDESPPSIELPPTPDECHEAVKKAFKWGEVANATVDVYKKVQEMEKTTIRQLFKNYMSCGWVAGPFFVLVFALQMLILSFYEWIIPRDLIDQAPDYPSKIENRRAN